MEAGENIQDLGTAFRCLGGKILAPASELAGLQWGWKTWQLLVSLPISLAAVPTVFSCCMLFMLVTSFPCSLPPSGLACPTNF